MYYLYYTYLTLTYTCQYACVHVYAYACTHTVRKHFYYMFTVKTKEKYTLYNISTG